MINVGVIGTGYIGKVHLETLLRVPHVRVVALADQNLEMARELAAIYNIPRVVSDYRELLNDSQIQVLHNCTPNHLHFEINKAILESGRDLLTEKPLAVTVEQARVLCDLATAKNALTAIDFCYRYYPTVQEAAAKVHSGEIGKVHTVYGSYFQDWLLYETDYNWRLDKNLSGASNTVADIGSHWCDLAQFVANTRIVEVMADLRTILPVRKKSRAEVLTFARAGGASSALEDVPVEVEDYGSVLVHFENGASGAFSVCQLCAGRKCSIDLQVYGSQASVAWNHEHPSSLWIGHRAQASQVLIENPLLQSECTARFARLPAGHPLGYYDAVFNLFAEFYQGVGLKQRGARPHHTVPTIQDGYDELAIVDAILQSSLEKRWVAVRR